MPNCLQSESACSGLNFERRIWRTLLDIIENLGHIFRVRAAAIIRLCARRYERVVSPTCMQCIFITHAPSASHTRRQLKENKAWKLMYSPISWLLVICFSSLGIQSKFQAAQTGCYPFVIPQAAINELYLCMIFG